MSKPWDHLRQDPPPQQRLPITKSGQVILDNNARVDVTVKYGSFRLGITSGSVSGSALFTRKALGQLAELCKELESQ